MPSLCPGSTSPAILLAFLLLALVPGPRPAAAEPAVELAERAQALRAAPSPARYQQLLRFVGEHAGSESARQGSWVLGVTDFEQGRMAEAGEHLRAARESTQVGEYAAFYLAQAQAEQGLFESALGTLAEVSFAETALPRKAGILRAEILLRAGRPREAIQELTREPDLQGAPSLLFALAQAERAAGSMLDAVETLHRIYFSFPLSAEAEPANALLAELRSELGLGYPPPSEALRRTRAEILWALGAFRGARSAYVDLSVRSSEPTRAEARLRAALALYQLGSVTAACDELAKISSLPGGLEAELRSYRIRCDLRSGRPPRVDTDLAYLAASFPASRFTQEALLAAAAAALRMNDAVRARELYAQVLRAFPSDGSSAEPHWRLAWFAYQEGEKTQAERLMEEHLRRFPDSPFTARVLYWRAAAALEAGEDALAEHLFSVLAERAPRDYLTQQVERRWRQRSGAPASDEVLLPAWAEILAPPPLRPGPPPLSESQRRVQERAGVLERLGFREEASRELEEALAREPHPDLYLAQARLALAGEQFARASELLGRVYPAYWNYRLVELPRPAWETLFPRPYWEAVVRESRKNGLDPYLVAALIRQESRFEREAVSSAGALGLMQLMPGTARLLAGARRLPENRILDPDLNLRLGTRFLAQLLARFRGSLEKAVAGYNAGGTRVEEWSSERPSRDGAEFVENIPVTQTREFVYTVLRNYRFYRDLYGY